MPFPILEKVRNKIKHEKRAISNFKLYPSLDKNVLKDFEKVVVLNFSAKRLERHYYFLLKFLSLNGYAVLVIKNRGFLGSIEKFRKEFSNIGNVFFLNSIKASLPRVDLYLYDQPAFANAIKSVKSIHVRIDVFNYNKADKTHLLMSLPMSVEQYDLMGKVSLEALRKTSRSVKLFYSGNLDKANYNTNAIKHIYKKLSRVDIIDFLKENLSENEIEIRSSVVDKDELVKVNKFVLYDWYWKPGESNLTARIDNKDWLVHVSKADFFLGCPGIVMPLTHAIVEAMAVGCIPIIQFPECYPEGLIDMVNCVIFNNQEELLAKVRLVLGLADDEIAKLRDGVIAYYEKNLTPKAYIDNLEVFNNTEINYFIYTSYSHL